MKRLRFELFTPVVFIVQVGCAAAGPADDPAPNLPAEVITSTSSAGLIHISNEPGTGPRVLHGSVTRVWSTLPAVFETLDVPTQVINADGLEIGTAGYRPRRIEGRRLSAYLNCGMGAGGPRADDYEVTMSVVTRLTARSSDSTLVQTLVEANARPRTVSGGSVYCSSRGVLEMRLAQLILEQLAQQN